MILFTWENCPKCEEVKNYIKQNNIDIEILDQKSRKGRDIQTQYRIMSVPFLIKDNKSYVWNDVIPNL